MPASARENEKRSVLGSVRSEGAANSLFVANLFVAVVDIAALLAIWAHMMRFSRRTDAYCCTGEKRPKPLDFATELGRAL